MKTGEQTSEFKLTKWSMLLSLGATVLLSLCEWALSGQVEIGGWAVIAAIVANSIKASGYSSSRGKVKAADSIAANIKKKSLSSEA